MGITIDCPAHIAYGADEAMPSIDGGLDIEDAIYHTAHGYPGGIAALAQRMSVSANTLTHKANPNTTSHHMHPRELVAMQELSGNAAILHAMAARMGYTCQRRIPDQAGGNSVEAFMQLQCALSDFVRAVADPLARMEAQASTYPTGHELRRAEQMAGDLHGAIDHMLATLRAHKRPQPQ